MKKIYLSFVIAFTLSVCLHSQSIPDFTLNNVDGQKVSLSSFSASKAVVVIFTGNHCVYSKKYEDRIIKLAADYSPKNVKVVLVNSNAPDLSEDDRFEMMQDRAKEKGFSFPYLHDPDQAVAKLFNATKNPEAFVITPGTTGWTVAYSGLIDDNPLIADAVTVNYISKVLDQLLASGACATVPTSASGCTIKGIE